MSSFFFKGRRYAVETLDQIDEVRRGEEPSLSLRQAAGNVGLHFIQCKTCKGNGYTGTTLLASPRVVEALVAAGIDELVPIQYERCQDCQGSGGFVEG